MEQSFADSIHIVTRGDNIAMPLHTGVIGIRSPSPNRIGFVSHGGSHHCHRQPCQPLPVAVRAGIGFVWPRSAACPIHHNSFPVKHLPFVSFRSDWVCFARLGSSASALATLPALAHGCPPTGNWLRLARLSPVTAGLVALAAVLFPAGAGPIGFVWRNRPKRQFRRRLRRPASTSVCIGKLGLFVRPVPTTAPPVTSPVRARSRRCRNWLRLARFGPTVRA
jgi:hypothetical protein